MAKTLSSSFLSFIHENIQKTLFNKMSDSPWEGPRHHPRDSIKSTSTRTIWIKMTSGGLPVDEAKSQAPVILMGGELTRTGLPGGFSELYEPQIEGYDEDYGEKYKPPPGITNISCKTEGTYGSLRTATVTWNCWSLGQLERLDGHFMRIGASILLEWGWSSAPGETITFSPDEFRKATTDGKKRVLDNGGNYDVICGVVKNFSWASNAEGGFDCSTEIISQGTPMITSEVGNESDMGNANDETEMSEEAKQELKKLGMSNFKKYVTNMKLELLRHLNPNAAITQGLLMDDTSEADVMTGKNIEYRDTEGISLALGSLAFVSWGYFEDNVLSKYLGRVTGDEQIKYTFRSINVIDNENGSYNYESVQCSNHSALRTADSRICQFPGTGELEYGEFEPFAVPNSDNTRGYLRNIKLNVQFIIDCFEDVNTLAEGMEKIFEGVNSVSGDIFNFSLQQDSAIETNSRVVDMNVVENSVQDLLQPNMRSTPSDPTMVFYFPTWRSDNTIVINQSLNAKIPSPAMLSAMYGSNKVDVQMDKNPPKPEDGDIESLTAVQRQEVVDKFLGGFTLPDALHRTNTSYYGNAAGDIPIPGQSAGDMNNNLNWSSGGPPSVAEIKLSEIEKIISNKAKEASLAEDAKAVAKANDEDSPEVQKGFWAGVWDSAMDTVGDIATLASEAVDKISEGFDNLKRATHAAFSEYQLGEILPAHQIEAMKKKIQLGEENKEGEIENPEKGTVYKTDFILPLELSMEIDGIAGIYPGNVFSTDYLPSAYRPKVSTLHSDGGVDFRNGVVFMVKGISHDISADKWTTKFDGVMRASIPPPIN